MAVAFIPTQLLRDRTDVPLGPGAEQGQYPIYGTRSPAESRDGAAVSS